MQCVRCGVLGLSFFIAGCTYGKVHRNDGSAVEGALIEFYTVDFDQVWDAEPVSLRLETYARSLSASELSDPSWAGWYYLNPYAQDRLSPGDVRDLELESAWSRVRVTKPSFATRIFYRKNVFSDCPYGVAFSATPYSGGPYGHDL